MIKVLVLPQSSIFSYKILQQSADNTLNSDVNSRLHYSVSYNQTQP